MKSEEAARITTRVTPEGKPLRDEGEQTIKIFEVMPDSDTKDKCSVYYALRANNTLQINMR